MVTYTIQSKLDPSGISAGKAKVKQDLRDLDNTAKATASSMQQAFSSGSLERQVMGLSSQIKTLRGEVTSLSRTNSEIVQSNTRLSGSLDQVAAGLTREGTAMGASANAGERKVASDTQVAASVQRVLRAVDEEALELMKLNLLMEEATVLYQRGAISAEQYARVQRMVAQGAAQEGATLGQRRAGYQQLGFQIQDITMQAALGVNGLTILAQQAGQTAAAVTMMTGRVTGFWAFMGGPWGSVIIAAVAVLGQLAQAWFSAGDAAEENTQRSQDNLTAADALGRAQGALGGMFDLTTGKIKQNTEALRLNALATALNLQVQGQRQMLDAQFQLDSSRQAAPVTEGFLPAALRQARSSMRLIINTHDLNTEQGRAGAVQSLTSLFSRATDDESRTAISEMVGLINNQVQGAASVDIGRRAQASVEGGQLDKSLAHPGGGSHGGGGSHANPIGDFFQRLEQQRDIAGVPQGLAHRILDANQDFSRAANREPTGGPGGEQERIANIVRETEARETLLHLTQTYTEAAEREFQTITELGVRRKQHIAIMEEEARLGRSLDPLEEAVVREGVKNADSYQRQHAAIEILDGGLQEYSDNMEAYLALLRSGTITQAQFNLLVGQIPFQRQADQLDQALGGMRAYDAQLRQIDQAARVYIEQINARTRLAESDPNHLSAEEAARMRQEVGGPDAQGSGSDVNVGGPGAHSLRQRQIAAVNRQQHADRGQFDQELGGNFAYQADVQAENDHYQERLDQLRSFYDESERQGQEYRAREQAEHDRHNQRLAELDRARYQTALHAASQGFGDLADAIKGFAGEQSRVYRAMFIVSKAFAIAEAILGIQTAIAQAMKLPFPANIPAIATAVSLGASVLANIQAVTAQFKEGGYTGEGDPNDLAGMVHKREFVMPEAQTRRNRAALEAMKAGATYGGGGGGGGFGPAAAAPPVINLHNYGGSEVSVRPGLTPGEVDVMIDEKLRRDGPKVIAEDMAQPNGKTGKALKGNYGIDRNRK